MRAVLLVCVGLLLASVTAAAAPCTGGKELEAYRGRGIVLADNTLFFASKSLAFDLDGSPSAYGVRDQGLEDICNGLGPLQPPECRGRNQGKCYQACQAAFATWYKGGAKLNELASSMCAIGLGGSGCEKPVVRLQQAPWQDWFVSETTVHVARPVGTPATGWIVAQAAQLDPERVPYFVIPQGFRGQPWDATPGDAGLILDAHSGRSVAFVVGDTGGALNEASIAMHKALRGGSFPVKGKSSALGEMVNRYQGSTEGDFRIAIFRHTVPGTPSLLTLTAGQLGPWIEATVQTHLEAIGGVKRVRDCAQ